MHKRIICAIDVRISLSLSPSFFSSLLDMFYNHANTNLCMCVHVERRRTGKEEKERQRTKRRKKLSMNVYNEEQEDEKNVAPYIVFLP